MIDVPARVRDALRDGRLRKNYRINVLNSDDSIDFTIDNNTLVYESVKIDERMNSGDTMKFGLCEGSSLELQYFNHPNINGRRVQVLIDVEYMAPSKEYSEKNLLFDIPKAGQYTFSSRNLSYISFAINRNGINTYYELNFNNSYTVMLDLLDGDRFFIDEAEDPLTVTNNTGFSDYHTIPLGFYTVSMCSRQASTGIYKITAYNKLQSKYLDQKANERIKEITNGEVIGGTNGVDIGTLLDELLEGYSIKRRETVVPFSISSEVIPATDTSNIRQTDMDGSANGVYIHSLDITDYLMPAGFSSANFYRFRINFKNIFDAIYGYAGTTFLDDWFKNTSNVSERDRLSNWLKGTTSFISSLYVGAFQFNTSNGSKGYSIQTYRNQNNFVTPWFTNITSMVLGIAGLYLYSVEKTVTWTQEEIDEAKARVYDLLFTQGNFVIETSSRSDIERILFTSEQAAALPDVTLRELQSAVFEINGQYGKIDRVTDLFAGVDLNNSRLYPSDALYPANDLYPGGQSERGDSSAYSKLWTDSDHAESFKDLIITYKGLDEDNKEKEFKLQRTINQNGTMDYNMSNNWIFKNLVWTAEDVGDYADALVSKLAAVTWIPFELWCAGLPYMECGDELEITNSQGTFISYILQRTLQGIHNLQDTYINGTLDIF